MATKIKIKPSGSNDRTIASKIAINYFNIMFVSSPADGRKQASSICTCRDVAMSAVLSRMRGDKGEVNITRLIDLNNLRVAMPIAISKENPIILTRWKKRMSTSMLRAVRFIRAIEEVAGWHGRTVITSAHFVDEHALSGAVIKTRLVTGPKEWMAFPPLTSLVLLILRACSDAGDQFPERVASTKKGVREAFETIIKSVQTYDVRNYVAGQVDEICSMVFNSREVIDSFKPDLLVKQSTQEGTTGAAIGFNSFFNVVDGNGKSRVTAFREPLEIVKRKL